MFKQNSLFAVLLICSPINYADQWSLDAGLRQETAYDDNVGMSKTAQGSIEYKLIPTINFAHKTQTSLIQASASYGMQRYLAIKKLDSYLQNYKLSGSYLTERTYW